MKELPVPTLPLMHLLDRRSTAPVNRQVPHPAPAVPGPQEFEVVWARHHDDVRAAQRLRWSVFVDEMGARLTPPPGSDEALDVDRFDDFCEHLLVRSLPQDGRAGEVIGTYRVLTPGAARRAGALYSEGEFDLTPLQSLRPRLVELGRSCVHPEHRSGGVIMALWGELAAFMARNGLDTMVGCASITMNDGGHHAASLWRQLSQTHLADPRWHVTPHLPLPVAELDQSVKAEAPPLLRGYLRCGARVLGAPAWDPDFNTADLPVMLQLADLPERYRRHFLRAR